MTPEPSRRVKVTLELEVTVALSTPVDDVTDQKEFDRVVFDNLDELGQTTVGLLRMDGMADRGVGWLDNEREAYIAMFDNVTVVGTPQLVAD